MSARSATLEEAFPRRRATAKLGEGKLTKEYSHMLALIFAGLSTGFALIAVGISFYRLKVPVRALRDLATQLGDIEHDLESQRSTVRRLNARVGMREAREKQLDAKKEDPTANGVDGDANDTAQWPGETNEQWKARTRRRLHMNQAGS